MSVSELAEGLKKKVASLGIVNPSVKPSVCQLPVREPFGALSPYKSCPRWRGKWLRMK